MLVRKSISEITKVLSKDNITFFKNRFWPELPRDKRQFKVSVLRKIIAENNMFVYDERLLKKLNWCLYNINFDIEQTGDIYSIGDSDSLSIIFYKNRYRIGDVREVITNVYGL